MKKATLVLSVISTCLLGPGLIHAEPPATRPARIAIPKDETPRDALLRGGKVYDLLDIDAAMELFDYSGEAETKLCRLGCECDIAISRLQKSVRDKWGKDVDDAVAHALCVLTEDDVKQADIKVDGDHAIVQCKGDGALTFPMVKVNGVWKFAWHEIISSMTPAEMKGFVFAQTTHRDQISKIIADLKNGKLQSAEGVIAAAKKASDDASKPAGAGL